MEQEDDDVPQLSAETFNILQQFYAEQAEREKELMKQQKDLEKNVQFEENWQLSQFWYDDDTITKLVTIIINSVGPDSNIALISAPSLYNELKRRCRENNLQVKLLEFDRRFSIHEDFVFYDYAKPLELPSDLIEKSFDLVVCDPPFLSDECLSNVAQTVRFLSKNRVILCTGATMESLANEKLGLTRTSFVPHHKNNLANEFCCYSNYDISGKL